MPAPRALPLACLAAALLACWPAGAAAAQLGLGPCTQANQASQCWFQKCVGGQCLQLKNSGGAVQDPVADDFTFPYDTLPSNGSDSGPALGAVGSFLDLYLASANPGSCFVKYGGCTYDPCPYPNAQRQPDSANKDAPNTFSKSCDSPENLLYFSCFLYCVAAFKCKNACYHPNPSLPYNPVYITTGKTRFADKHWMLLPSTPVRGVEDWPLVGEGIWDVAWKAIGDGKISWYKNSDNQGPLKRTEAVIGLNTPDYRTMHQMHIHTGKLQQCYRDQLNGVSKSSSGWTQLSLCGAKQGAGESQMTGKARFFASGGAPSTVRPFRMMADNCGALFPNKRCSLVIAGVGTQAEVATSPGYYVVIFHQPSYSEQFIV